MPVRIGGAAPTVERNGHLVFAEAGVVTNGGTAGSLHAKSGGRVGGLNSRCGHLRSLNDLPGAATRHGCTRTGPGVYASSCRLSNEPIRFTAADAVDAARRRLVENKKPVI